MVSAARRRAKAILDEPERVILRYGVFERFLLPGFLLISFGLIGINQFTFGTTSADLAGILVIAVAVVVAWTAAFRVIVAVGRTELVVRNPLRTHVVALRDITSLEPAYEGLVIRTRDCKKITAAAVQRWNLALFLRHRSRADDAADAIVERQRSLQSAG